VVRSAASDAEGTVVCTLTFTPFQGEKGLEVSEEPFQEPEESIRLLGGDEQDADVRLLRLTYRAT